MPAESEAQFRWLHTKDAEEKLGKAGVKEWIDATPNPSSLPKRKKTPKAKKPPVIYRHTTTPRS